MLSVSAMAVATMPTPDELLLRPEPPPSPSVFLDLPPTPPGAADDHPASFHDSMDYISRMLMEEDIDDHFFYHYPDHPAVLRAQLPFAEILSSSSSSTAATSSSDGSTTTISPSSSSPLPQPLHSPFLAGHDGGSSVFFDGHAAEEESTKAAPFHGATPSSGSDFLRGFFPGGNMEVLNQAFLKGMEEAIKFLPTEPSSLADGKPVQGEVVDGMLGRRKGMCDGDEPEAEAEEGRASKLMAPEPETDENGAREMFDEMMLGDHDICMKGVKDQSIAADAETERGKKKARRRRRRRRTADAQTTVDLHTLLLHCAQAVSTDDRRSAAQLLQQIKRSSSPHGDAAQRLAHYFGEALEARLVGTGSQLYQSLMVRRTSVVDFLKAYRLFMATCCCKKVAFTFSNATILDAVAGRSRLHIVDYGVGYGFQWSGLLRLLAAGEGGPPEVRMTGIDLPQPGFRPAFHVEETGRRLSDCARRLGVPFMFRGIAAKRESVRPEELGLDAGEVLVVSSLCHFRHLMDENLAVDGGPSPRDEVLGNIRRMRPDVFIHGVLSGGYGATTFLTRFREALFHHAAQFELLDATVGRDSSERLTLERDVFGRAAVNVVACEGADRVERPETYRQWAARSGRAGLRQLPLKPEVVRTVLAMVGDNYHKDFVVDEDGRWLLHRWKGRVLYAMSTWVAHDHASLS